MNKNTMNKITTCLPLLDNEGNDVGAAVNKVAEAFGDIATYLTGVKGEGLWRNDAGVVFRDPVLVLTATLSDSVDLATARGLVESALLVYKQEAAQESVVMAINDPESEGTVEELLAAHGGCTQVSTDDEGNETARAFSFVSPIFL